MAKLIHHDERSRIANSEFSFICHFMRRLATASETSSREYRGAGARERRASFSSLPDHGISTNLAVNLRAVGARK